MHEPDPKFEALQKLTRVRALACQAMRDMLDGRGSEQELRALLVAEALAMSEFKAVSDE